MGNKMSRGLIQGIKVDIYIYIYQGNMYLVANIPKPRLLQTCNIYIYIWNFLLMQSAQATNVS